MGKGRHYNNQPPNDEDESKSKVKKVTITSEEKDSNVADSEEEQVPVANSGEDSKPVAEREPEEDTATTDDDRYKAASG
jgi:hypothetical protein